MDYHFKKIAIKTESHIKGWRDPTLLLSSIGIASIGDFFKPRRIKKWTIEFYPRKG